ncbi:Uma2 family endonuclease [Streptomyces sp. NPDC085932]|uniref:Uma2 family endonuclease n=1 Tax=Streptomyces sp. NPDC085932 TaxID=3365741 RepID=UPI0037D17687
MAYATPSGEGAGAGCGDVIRPTMMLSTPAPRRHLMSLDVGLWLPTGSEDYAIPDLVVVNADIDDHLVVTSGNWKDDLRTKAAAYAEAKVPVYVVVDRKHQRLRVLTDPVGSGYENHRPHAPGELVTLPDSIGAKVTLDVGEILKAGQARTSD